MKNAKLKQGNSVVAKAGAKVPDLGCDIKGWQGRIVEMNDDIFTIEWDSITLKNMAVAYIEQCEEEEIAWWQVELKAEDIELAIPGTPKMMLKKRIMSLKQNTARMIWTKKKNALQQFSAASIRMTSGH